MRPGIDQTEIGLDLGLDRTTTADVVRRLELKKCVKRDVDPTDRRARRVFITKEGDRVLQKLYPRMIAASDRMLAPLSAARRKMFVEILADLVRANDQYGRAPISGL
jgi:DNA-binding MarR family transcriptional regulator